MNKITEEELRSQIRRQGLESAAGVKRAYMERNGSVSLVTAKRQGLRPGAKQKDTDGEPKQS